MLWTWMSEVFCLQVRDTTCTWKETMKKEVFDILYFDISANTCCIIVTQEVESNFKSYTFATDNLSLSNKNVSFLLQVRIFESW